jgi:hypothetical protein
MWRSMVRIVLLKGPPHNIHLFFGAATFAIIAGALAQAGGEAGEVRQLLTEAARPGLKAPFEASIRPDSLDALRSLARTSELVGRDEALDALMSFLGAPDPLLWTVVSGEAGTGKTRLAAELVAFIRGTAPGGDPAIPGGWRAGFYDATDWLQAGGHKWTPETDTLIVVDYAGKYANALARN